MKECMKEFTQPDLEDEEEVGMQDRDPATIVDYCRRAMGIYDFYLNVERLEKLGFSLKEIRLVLKYLRIKHRSNTLFSQILGSGF
jgi:hypothetical protein